jgi:hypothetical protein
LRLPISERVLVNAEDLGSLFLQDTQVQAALPEVVSYRIELFRIIP